MTQARWLSDEEQIAWRRLIRVVELLPGLLDSQLQRDAGLTHFEYFSLAMLSEAPNRTLRLTQLAAQTNSTLPRLSHVITRLESRGLVARSPADSDRRATNATLTDAGWDVVVRSAPAHVQTVRDLVIDPLDSDDVEALTRIATKIARRLDPEERMGPLDDPAR